MTIIKVVRINKRKIFFYALGFILLLLVAFGLRALIHWERNVPAPINEKESVFVFESGVEIDENLFDEDALRKVKVTASLKNAEPTVLILHTHISEAYEGGGTVEDVGKALGDILAQRYGITVVHDVNVYDKVDGENKVEGAYERMEAGVAEILEKYPSIQLVLDIHRDYNPADQKVMSFINDKIMAPLMLVNGVCTAEDSPWNEYLTENLALSLQVYEQAGEDYPGLLRKNYIKPYRYSTHMKPLSLLIEVGFQNNTLEEAVNSMEPLADTLVKTIEKR